MTTGDKRLAVLSSAREADRILINQHKGGFAGAACGCLEVMKHSEGHCCQKCLQHVLCYTNRTPSTAGQHLGRNAYSRKYRPATPPLTPNGQISMITRQEDHIWTRSIIVVDTTDTQRCPVQIQSNYMPPTNLSQICEGQRCGYKLCHEQVQIYSTAWFPGTSIEVCQRISQRM